MININLLLHIYNISNLNLLYLKAWILIYYGEKMLKIENLSKKYNEKTIGPFNFEIHSNQTISIIGKSGSGKSTLVKLITNVIEQTTGNVEFYNSELKKEDFIYISQIGTLFNHLTILENLLLTYSGDISFINNTLEEVNLSQEYLNKYPFELSGGERQRIDLIRAIISKSKIMILDEAFSALDTSTKDDIYDVLKNIRARYKLIIIIITHDLDEALFLGDNIILLEDGKEVFYDTPNIFLKSENENIKRLINPHRLERLKKVYLHE